ncbi:MAG: tRNA 2-selenouridine(34) synthase MnmH [Tissierellales bacterium]|nr:tRNA 2-selenouridine(34) synthase MnmH [Tissierellales bacterium]MBN2826708.1 tRNA 2-selenouridine(34) synthase MnmH [Tissierellales bacterium]
MFITLPYEQLKEKGIFIDVRTEKEYLESHIPSAINIPLFTNDERIEIGTAYKQNCVDEARRLGVKYASKKMPEIFEKLLLLRGEHQQHLVAYCARGGYRSTFFSSAFSSIGIRVLKLEGGYKSYRQHVINRLIEINHHLEYIVIHGNTGTGKTEILTELSKMGCDVLDLEGAANHRGSLLGSIGLGDCESQKQFESNLYDQMDKFKTSHIFVEAESRRIGNVMIPQAIHDRMKKGKHIFIDRDIKQRIEIIKKDYTSKLNWKEESIKGIKTLVKYIPESKIDELVEELEYGNVEEVIEFLMLNYYDPLYMNKSNSYKYDLKTGLSMTLEEIARRILEWMNQNTY